MCGVLVFEGDRATRLPYLGTGVSCGSGWMRESLLKRAEVELYNCKTWHGLSETSIFGRCARLR